MASLSMASLRGQVLALRFALLGRERLVIRYPLELTLEIVKFLRSKPRALSTICCTRAS